MNSLCDSFDSLSVQNVQCIICNKSSIEYSSMCNTCLFNYKSLMIETCITCGSKFIPDSNLCVECNDCEERYGGEDMNCDA